MCGIAGMFSNFLSKTELDVFCDLLAVSYLRGTDSTGVFTLKRDYQAKKDEPNLMWNVRKEAVDPFEFVNSSHMDALRQGSPLIMLGHTRAATKGSISARNAHPFVFDKVAGVHNGTLEGNYPFKTDYETDSEALYRLINDKGIEEALKEIENVSSYTAYSLVFYDFENNTLNFIRNHRRPMTLAWSSGKGCLIWSSEYAFLDFVMSRRGMKMSQEGGFTPFSTEPGVLYTFDLEENQAHQKFTTKKFDFIRTSDPVNKGGYYDQCMLPEDKGGSQKGKVPFQQKAMGGTIPIGNQKGYKRNRRERKKTIEIKGHEVNFFETYNGRMETKATIEKHLLSGCAFCSGTNDFKDFEDNKILFIDGHGTFLCDDCSSNPEVVSSVLFNPGSNIYS